MKPLLLPLALFATLSVSGHEKNSNTNLPIEAITTRLPEDANAWVCEYHSNSLVCDAAAVKGETFKRLAFPENKPKNLNGYLRVDQSNGLVVYWLVRLTM